ncbi:MAG: 6-bladed beta-propeller [Aggregatilineales bacterium]
MVSNSAKFLTMLRGAWLVVAVVMACLFVLNASPAHGQPPTPVPTGGRADAFGGNKPSGLPPSVLSPRDVQHPPSVASNAPSVAAHPDASLKAPSAAHVVSANGSGPLGGGPSDALRSFHFTSANSASGATPFAYPFLMGSDSTGNIYVSDVTTNFVGVFSSNLGSIRALGVPGANSNAAGQFAGPEGIAVVGSTVFVGDFGNSRVESFSQSSGAYLAQFAVTGNPTGMVYNPLDGLLYVVEVNAGSPANRIEKFTTAGVSSGSFALSSTGYGLAIDSAGYLYVTQGTSIGKYQTNGAFVRSIGSFGSVFGVAVDRSGFVYGVDSAGSLPIVKFDWQGNVVATYAVTGTQGADGFLHGPQGIAVSNVQNAAPVVYVADTQNKLVDMFTPVLEPVTHTFQSSFGSAGSGLGQFAGPYDTAMDSARNFYVTDSNHNRVEKFDSTGAFVTSFGNTGGAGQLNFPRGIAINSADHVYVVDDNNSRVVVYDSSGNYLSSFGSSGTSNGQFQGMAEITIDRFDYIYVADPVLNRVQEFTPSGTFYAVWGTAGTGGGKFSTATGVAVDSNRALVYTVDFIGAHLQAYNWFGTFVRDYAAATSGPGQLINPYGVSVDARGNIYVADRGRNQIVQFDAAGNYVTAFGITGSGVGQFGTANSVFIDNATGQMYITDLNNNNVQRWGAMNPKNDTIGIYRASTETFYLRNSNTTGYADINTPVSYAAAGDLALVGDWNGDGVDTIGLFRNGQFLLQDSNRVQSGPDYNFVLGIAGDTPLVGDWNGNGADRVGVFRPSNGLIYLRSTLTTGFADFTMVLGIPGDVGLAGDWNGDGQDSPGVYRPSTIRFYLSDKVTNGPVFGDYTLALGLSGDVPISGDWIHQGSSGVGVFRPTNGIVYLKNILSPGFADTEIVYGIPNDQPVAGHWGLVPGAPIPPPHEGSPAIIVPGAPDPVAPASAPQASSGLGD